MGADPDSAGFCRNHLCPRCHRGLLGKIKAGTQPIANGTKLVRFAHVVLSVPHTAAEPLEDVWNRLENCRTAFLAGRWMASHADAYRLRTHITWSEHGGFNVHDHLVLAWASSFPEMSRRRAVAASRWAAKTTALGITTAPLFYEERPLPALRRYVFGNHFLRKFGSDCEAGLQIGHLAALADTGDVEHFRRWEEIETASFNRKWTGVGGAWFDQRRPQRGGAEAVR